MNNENGFSLVELLAMLVVLGILIAVAVPNMSGIVNNTRESALKSDATIMVDKAKVVLSTNKNIKRPNNNSCQVFTLDYLDDNDDLKKGPNDGVYNRNESFVVVERKGNQILYFVRIIEEKNNKASGIAFADSTNIGKQESNITTLGLNGNNADSNKIRSFLVTKSHCGSGLEYHYER